MPSDRLITVAIHTFDRAHRLKEILEADGIAVTLQNVNLTSPSVSAGIRVRIHETDLPQALRIIENIEILSPSHAPHSPGNHRGTILVPTDFSDKSLSAAILAMRMAASLGATVHLLHTFIDPSFSPMRVRPLSDSPVFDDPLEAEAEIKEERSLAAIALGGMRKFEEWLREKIRLGVVPGVRFTSEITEGIPEEAIDAYCASHANILTIMGNDDSDTSRRDIMGSITAEVLDNNHTSILALPASSRLARTGVPSRIIFFATATQNDIITLDTLYRLYPDIHLEVTIAVASTKAARSASTTEGSHRSSLGAMIPRKPTEITNLLHYCRAAYPAFTFRMAQTTAAEPLAQLRELTATALPDLILVSNHRRNIFSRLFSPTLAHRLLFNTSIPLLSISTTS